jgi:hypothetical protein
VRVAEDIAGMSRAVAEGTLLSVSGEGGRVMQRKMVCALIMLTVGVGALAAAEGKHSILLDRSYPGLVVKVDDAKHTLVIHCKGPDGKSIEKPLLFSGMVKLSDIKPGIRYRFFEQGGKVIAVQPIVISPSAKNPPSGTGIAPAAPTQFAKAPLQPAVKGVNAPTPQKPTPLITALAEARKADQAKSAATLALKAKTEAYRKAVVRSSLAQQFAAQADAAKTMAGEMLKGQEASFYMTQINLACATATASRAEALANLAETKVVLAQADALRAKAAVKVAGAQVSLAKVDARNATQAKAFALGFEKAKAVVAKLAHMSYLQAKAIADKAFQEQQAAQQIEKQQTKAADQAAARVKQIQKEQGQSQHARIEVKKEVNKSVAH